MLYKALGYIVWKGVVWDLRRRYGTAPKKISASALVAVAIAGGIVIAQRRFSAHDD